MEAKAAYPDDIQESNTKCYRAADAQYNTVLLKEVLECCMAEQFRHSYVLIKLYR
jgi:hypothetical protein